MRSRDTLSRDAAGAGVSAWVAGHHGQIQAFRKALAEEPDYIKQKAVRRGFFEAHFELKRCRLSIVNQPRNALREEKRVQGQIDDFIHGTIGLPQGDLSLDIIEAGHVETTYVGIKKSGDIAGVFTGWPQRDAGTGEAVFYAYLCASHPGLSGLAVGTRLHEHFFEENETRKVGGKPYYSKFIGAVNPFGREAFFHIHKLGAVCNGVIERNPGISGKFPYYGGITPHRLILEFTARHQETAIERRRKHGAPGSYTPKAYAAPKEWNVMVPGDSIPDFRQRLSLLGQDDTLVLCISSVGEKFNRLGMGEGERGELERESCLFYDHCIVLFEKGYRIVDCRLERKGENMGLGYVFHRC